ncbi:MAG: efflux RND transporter periplasmic adaptor subunit [Nitrospirae bacterium]|nr:efflux RND transporter periplasmic adaptor subunit [Nitrospirota bacterium]
MEERRNFTRFILIGVILLVVGILLGLVISQLIKRPVEKVEVKKERKILYYRNPMNPAIKSDKPTKDEMGMDYIPVYEGEEAPADEPGVFKIPIERVQKIGVRSEAVEYRPLKRIIRTVGIVEYDEKKLYFVNTKVGGWIENLFVNITGQIVNKGDPLLAIYSPELVSTQQEYLEALRAEKVMRESSFEDIKKGAESLLSVTRQRFKYWDISEEQIRRLEQEGVVNRTMTIISPVKGIVIEKPAIKGMFINPGENLYKIADISTVWVQVDIYEYEMHLVGLGQTAKITFGSYPGKTFYGKVVYLYPYHEPTTRTMKVRIELQNQNFRFMPTMYANVEIDAVVSPKTLAVPDTAIIDTGERQIAIVDKGDGRFEPRLVKVGARAEGYVEVLSGLRSGEKVVTSANFLIDSESNLKAALGGIAGHIHAPIEEKKPPSGIEKRHEEKIEQRGHKQH